MRTPRRPRALRAAVAFAAALACAGATAGTAGADSIAYVKDGDVWLATPDGARQFQVTDRGGYSDVSQADDGTMIALRGVRLHRLDRMGNVLADFDTPVSDTRRPGERVFWGPYQPAISPDGTKVAYHWYYTTTTEDPTCFPPECVVIIREAGTAYSHADRQTGWDEPGLTKHSGWRNPIWADDATTILSDPSRMPNADVVIDAPGEREGHGFMVQNWFSDNVGGNPHLAGGDITRQHDRMAFVTGDADSTLTLYSVPRFRPRMRDGQAVPEDRPSVCYRYSGAAGGEFGTPTFAPDGNRIAYSDAAGIHVAQVPSFANGCTVEGATVDPPVVVPGGTEPDWGPADVPTSRPAPGPGGPGPGGPGPGEPGPGGPGPGGPGPGPGPTGPVVPTPKPEPRTGERTLVAQVVSSSRRAVLRRGLRVRVTAARAGRATIAVRAGRRRIALVRRTLKAGTATLTVRLGRQGRSRLRRAGSRPRLSVVVSLGEHRAVAGRRLGR